MEEEEVNYASVVFKTQKKPQSGAKKEEETVYDEVKVRNEQQNAASVSDKKDHRRLHYQQLACFLGILCVILVAGIVGLSVFLATLSRETELQQLKENQTTLLAANQNLTDLNKQLSSQNENLTKNNENLTNTSAVLERKITALTEENKNLRTDKQHLETRNQDLETQKNNLTKQIGDMQTEWNQQNISRAQWSIDVYCPKKDGRKCNSCADGWKHDQSSCYAINNPQPEGQKNWTEARDDCRGKASDFAVIVNEAEKRFISDNSWDSRESEGKWIDGYWIGLRVEDGKWKWIDGRNVTQTSWINPPTPTAGHCAISVQNRQWLQSVNCRDKYRWICKKKALSV